jgi:hypothetical protein
MYLAEKTFDWLNTHEEEFIVVLTVDRLCMCNATHIFSFFFSFLLFLLLRSICVHARAHVHFFLFVTHCISFRLCVCVCMSCLFFSLIKPRRENMVIP